MRSAEILEQSGKPGSVHTDAAFLQAVLIYYKILVCAQVDLEQQAPSVMDGCARASDSQLHYSKVLPRKLMSWVYGSKVMPAADCHTSSSLFDHQSQLERYISLSPQEMPASAELSLEKCCLSAGDCSRSEVSLALEGWAVLEWSVPADHGISSLTGKKNTSSILLQLMPCEAPETSLGWFEALRERPKP